MGTQRPRDTWHRSRERRIGKQQLNLRSLLFLCNHICSQEFLWSVSCIHIIAAAVPQFLGRGLAKYGQSLMPMILINFHFNVLRIVVRAVPSPCPTIGDSWLLVPATCKFGNSPPEGRTLNHLKLYKIASSVPCWQLWPVRLHDNRPALEGHSYPWCSTRVRFLEFLVSCVRPPTPKIKHDLRNDSCVPVASHAGLHGFYALWNTACRFRTQSTTGSVQIPAMWRWHLCASHVDKYLHYTRNFKILLLDCFEAPVLLTYSILESLSNLYCILFLPYPAMSKGSEPFTTTWSGEPDTRRARDTTVTAQRASWEPRSFACYRKKTSHHLQRPIATNTGADNQFLLYACYV